MKLSKSEIDSAAARASLDTRLATRYYTDSRVACTKVTVRELLQMLVDNRHNEVIDVLANDHPALTAVLFAQGVADGRLDSTDMNHIANMLIERRQQLFINQIPVDVHDEIL